MFTDCFGAIARDLHPLSATLNDRDMPVAAIQVPAGFPSPAADDLEDTVDPMKWAPMHAKPQICGKTRLGRQGDEPLPAAGNWLDQGEQLGDCRDELVLHDWFLKTWHAGEVRRDGALIVSGHNQSGYSLSRECPYQIEVRTRTEI